MELMEMKCGKLSRNCLKEKQQEMMEIVQKSFKALEKGNFINNGIN